MSRVQQHAAGVSARSPLLRTITDTRDTLLRLVDSQWHQHVKWDFLYWCSIDISIKRKLISWMYVAHDAKLNWPRDQLWVETSGRSTLTGVRPPRLVARVRQAEKGVSVNIITLHHDVDEQPEGSARTKLSSGTAAIPTEPASLYSHARVTIKTRALHALVEVESRWLTVRGQNTRFREWQESAIS